MPYDVPNAVEELDFPSQYMEILKQAPDLMLQALKRDGPPIESGLINIGKIDESMKTAFFFFHWVTEINEVIKNINIILSDMRELPKNYIMLKGSPSKRFYILYRMYFYEFYRFREIFSSFVKIAAERHHIKRDEAKSLRKLFHDAFSEVIGVRNTLVHNSPIWKGEDHFDLSFFGSAWEQDMVMKHLETGEIHDISKPLARVCPKTADILEGEAKRTSYVLDKIIGLIASMPPAENDAEST
mgnify:CR=1 FL=1|jgi:hypothetical protein